MESPRHRQMRAAQLAAKNQLPTTCRRPAADDEARSLDTHGRISGHTTNTGTQRGMPGRIPGWEREEGCRLSPRESTEPLLYPQASPPDRTSNRKHGT
jgi:hypothetical protein